MTQAAAPFAPAPSLQQIAIAAPPLAPVVRAEGLRKRFPVRRRWIDALRRPGERQHATALHGISFEAYGGEILGLLGSNGAGKTTLLKILSTLVTPDAGHAEVAGFDVVAQPDHVRGVLAPVAADERSLDWRLSARENLHFFGALHGFRGPDLRRVIKEVLGTVELLDTGQKLVGAFSSGMRQRLLIARALMSRPRVLLLDEPTRSLDPVSARSFRAFLRREIAGTQGCTVLLATHDPEEALELCDRVLILDRGRLVASGSPAELIARFGDERYRVWTRAPEHAAFTAALERGLVLSLRRLHRSDGWTVVEMDLPAGTEDAPEVLASLVTAGAQVGRFEKVNLTLADMLERAIQRSHRPGDV